MKRFAIIIGLLSGFLFGVATPFSKLVCLKKLVKESLEDHSRF